MKIDYNNLLKELIKDYKITVFEKPYIICLIGGHGYGKSYLAKLISKKANIPIVSNDRTRRFLETKGLDPTNQELVHNLAYLQIEYLIKNKSSVILDANAIRQHEIITKKAQQLNINCFYINLTCNQSLIIERLKKRQSQFGKDDNYSRATTESYYSYLEELKTRIFPKEKIFFEVKTDQELDSQVEKLLEQIKKIH